MKNHLFKILFVLIFVGCDAHQNDYTESISQWRYDSNVINNLPKYDSLKQVIISNIESFGLTKHQHYEFTYIYNFNPHSQISGHSNDDLPKATSSRVKDIIIELGEENIYGFRISKDSSLEILIRNTHLQDYFLDVRERLNWEPRNHMLWKTVFPAKDTLLSNNWKYLVWFDKRSNIF